MRHRRATRKFNRTASHRLRMFQHLVEGLFKSWAIVTTVEKAKEVRPIAEELITLGRKGDPQSQRQAQRTVRDKMAYQTLFTKIGPHFAERNGGYTRILRLARRPGDGAEVALLELVDREKLGPPPGKPVIVKKEAKEKAGAGAA